jgi:hypothetical protein
MHAKNGGRKWEKKVLFIFRKSFCEKNNLENS